MSGDEEENRLIRLSHMIQSDPQQQLQSQQNHRRMNTDGIDGVRGSATGNLGILTSSRRNDNVGSSSSSSGGSSSAEFVDSNCNGENTKADSDPRHEQKDEHNWPIGDECQAKEMNAALRKCTVVSNWQTTPAYEWRDVEKPSVNQEPSHVTQLKTRRKIADMRQRFLDAGGFSDVDDSDKTAGKVVAVVLAFQRWRHTQLKNIFSQELKKVLEEAWEDESTLANLETELENSEERLSMALAESAQLRSQLAAANNRNRHELANCPTDPTERERESDRRLMRVMESLTAAETEVQRRDNEIQLLKDRLKHIEEKGGHLDVQFQSRLSLLQAEKNGALEENRALLEQLARRDEELRMQGEELERLNALVNRLVERQSVDQQHINSLRTEHNAEIQSLQEQLRRAYGAKCSKEMELASYSERFSGLRQERETLVMQLHHAVERANVASCRAEELQMKLHCTAEDRAKASEEVALEMVKHLKRLTDHMRELESTVNSAEQHLSTKSNYHGGSSIAQANKSTTTDCGNYYSYASEENLGGDLLLDNNNQTCVANHQNIHGGQRHVYFSSLLDVRTTDIAHHKASAAQITAIDKLKRWITWKWRWAASSARAEMLAKELRGIRKVNSVNLELIYKQEKAEDLIQKLRAGNVATSMGRELNSMLTEHKLVPLILSAWRAFTKTCILEKKAISRSASLDKMMEALPWWIRRVGERRQLERNFFHWQLLTLRKRRKMKTPEPSSRNNKQLAKAPPVQLAHAHSEAGNNMAMHPTMPSKFLDHKAHSDRGPNSGAPMETGGTPLRRPVKGPTTKRNPGEGGKMSVSFSQPAETCHGLKPGNGMITTSRALQALQTSLQQEVIELQKILSQEIRVVQHEGNGRQLVEPSRVYPKHLYRHDHKQALRSVLGVCNNLAIALTGVRTNLCSSLGDTASNLKGNNRWMKMKRDNPCMIPEEISRGQCKFERKTPRGDVMHVAPKRQITPRGLCHPNPWLGGGIHMDSPNQAMRRVPHMTHRESRHQSPQRAEVEMKIKHHHQSGTHSRDRSLSPSAHKAENQVATQGCTQHQSATNSSHGHENTAQEQQVCKMKGSKRKSGREYHAPPRTMTVVEITPDGNNCSEIAVRTEIAQEYEPSTADDRKTLGPVQSAGTVPVKEKAAEDRAHLVSLKDKSCIGTAYANLLTAEIGRLRQGRGNGSQNIESREGGEAHPSTTTPMPMKRRCRS